MFVAAYAMPNTNDNGRNPNFNLYDNGAIDNGGEDGKNGVVMA